VSAPVDVDERVERVIREAPHVTPAMTEHYSHVGRAEKLAAAGSVVRLVFGGGSGEVGD